MTKYGASLGVLAAALCISSAEAYARSIADVGDFRRDRNISVRERDKNEFEARGIRAGRYFFYPEFTATTKFDDNVFADEAIKESDSIGVVQGRAAGRSDWRRHAFNFTAAAESTFYSEFNTLDSTDGFVQADARFDIVTGSYLTVNLGYADSHEDRAATPTAQTLSEAVEVERGDVGLELVTTFNRVRLSSKASVRQDDYTDVRDINGVFLDQDIRDNDVYSAEARVDYAVSPDTALFVEASRNWRNHDIDPPAGVVGSRDSDGYAALTGVDFDLSNVMRGEIGVGYFRQMHEDPTISDAEGLAVSAKVEWFPDELVTIGLSGEREARDSGVVGAATRVTSEVEARLDYEMRRNMVLGVRAGYAEDDYQGADRQDERLSAGIELNYLINETADAFVQTQYIDQASSGVARGRDFEVNRISVGLRLRR